MKGFFKRVLYKIAPPQFKKGYTFSVGFIFHTEQIYRNDVFDKLTSFCMQFSALTGKRPLCVVMSPVNKRVANELQEHGFTIEQFTNRLKKLHELADIGYHGHFWRRADDFEMPTSHIRHRNYRASDDENISDQFKTDYRWLEETGRCKPYYGAGWWFINPAVVQVLAKHKIAADFSFTRLAWVDNSWVKEFLKRKNIRFGESFQIRSENTVLQCIQTVMGCPNTDFPDDFVRIINNYLDSNRQVTGMIATHDYNLSEGNNLTRAIELVSYLVKHKAVAFHSAAELIGKAHQSPKVIQLADVESIR